MTRLARGRVGYRRAEVSEARARGCACRLHVERASPALADTFRAGLYTASPFDYEVDGRVAPAPLEDLTPIRHGPVRSAPFPFGSGQGWCAARLSVVARRDRLRAD